MKTINVALVGLGFGGCFLPIYADHPNVGVTSYFDANPATMARFKEMPTSAAVSSPA